MLPEKRNFYQSETYLRGAGKPGQCYSCHAAESIVWSSTLNQLCWKVHVACPGLTLWCPPV